MAAINSNHQLANLIEHFRQEKADSEYNIKKILLAAKTLQPVQTGVKNSAECTEFRQLLNDELIKYKAFEEFSKKLPAFIEAINLDLITRQDGLNNACFILHKAEGNTGLVDLLPAFGAYYLQKELDHQKQFPVNVQKPILKEDESDLINSLDEMIISVIDKDGDQESQPENEVEGPIHLDSDFSVRIRNAIFDSKALVTLTKE